MSQTPGASGLQAVPWRRTQGKCHRHQPWTVPPRGRKEIVAGGRRGQSVHLKRIYIRASPCGMGNLSERKMFQTRGKASFVRVTRASGGKRSFLAHRCDFCCSRQSWQLHGDTYLEERSGYVGVVGSRSQRD